MLTSRTRRFTLIVVLLVASASLAVTPSCVTLLPMDVGPGPAIVARDKEAVAAPATHLSDLATLEAQLLLDVEMLAHDIGPRHAARPAQLRLAESHIVAALARAGYAVQWQTYPCVAKGASVEVSNIWVEIKGSDLASEIVVIGAHYDTCVHGTRETPGADDNASGVAGTLALARAFAGSAPRRTVRFVFFTNEEPPHFWTGTMGSLVYARECKRKEENVVAMLSLECIGYYRDEPGTQTYPPLVGLKYPSTGDFIAFVGFSSAELLVRACAAAFLASSDVPATGAALPAIVPRVGSSDHWSFWKQGYPAIMVTDTAPHRNRNYHQPTDTADSLDYATMARVVRGLGGVANDLASPAP